MPELDEQDLTEDTPTAASGEAVPAPDSPLPSPAQLLAEDDEDDDYVTLNMHQIVENLWIGDFLSSQVSSVLADLARF